MSSQSLNLFLTLPVLQVPVYTDESKHFTGLEQKWGGSPIPLYSLPAAAHSTSVLTRIPW